MQDVTRTQNWKKARSGTLLSVAATSTRSSFIS